MQRNLTCNLVPCIEIHDNRSRAFASILCEAINVDIIKLMYFVVRLFMFSVTGRKRLNVD